MNKFRKALLGAASLLALTASGQKSADAAISPADTFKDKDTVDTGAKSAAFAGYAAYADPIYDLMKRTNGSLEPQAVESALREMLAIPSPAQVEEIPTLLASLSGLGAPSNVIARSRDVLIELVSKAPNISGDVIDTALSELQQGQPGVFKMAAVDDKHKRRRRRRPDELGDTGQRQPGEIGQTGVPGAASSDIRLKHDIALVGRLDNGLGLYHFSYIGSDKAYVGVMAQEVEAVLPEAVEYDSDGYRRVHYDMLGIRMQTWEEWVASGQNIPATRH
jgi:endosialidase-like protein